MIGLPPICKAQSVLSPESILIELRDSASALTGTSPQISTTVICTASDCQFALGTFLEVIFTLVQAESVHFVTLLMRVMGE